MTKQNDHFVLSDSQRQAVTHGAGPAMVLAGPGSGKTLVITYRIRYLIEKLGVVPSRILVITFTRAAARQMRDRFAAIHSGADGAAGVCFGTFHSVFFQILRNAYHYTADNILREDVRIRLLSQLADHYRLEGEDRRDLLAQLTTEISRVKNEQIDLEHYYAGVCSEEVFRKIFRSYQDYLQRAGLIDFDDMLLYTKQLFMARPDILSAWQKHFEWILVDEFQDINTLQYDVVKMLAAPRDNLFVVGDDDQSVYRFRGAKPEIMLGFAKDYPQGRMITLQENYRCAPAVSEAAGRVIAGNHQRYAKQIAARPADLEQDAPAVDIRQLKDLQEEGLYVLREIRASLANGRSPSQIAILTRTNVGGRYLAEKLMEFSIPFQMRDTMPDLYDHWITKDILTYCRLGAGSVDRGDFLRVMNKPLRYLSRDSVPSRHISFDQIRDYYEAQDRPWMIGRIDELEEDLAFLGNLKPYAAVNYIRSGIGYDKYLEEYARQRKMEPEDLISVADELQEQARGFDTFTAWSDHIDRYKQELEQQRAQRDSGPAGPDRSQPAVVLSTLHSAKGLEYEEVFLPDVNEGNIPYRKATLTADMEEERRLLYVGMTRAVRKLHILYVKERYGKKQEISHFLRPLTGGAQEKNK